MIALLKKDWRVNRAPVVGTLVVLLGVYAFAFSMRVYISQAERGSASISISHTFFSAGMFMLSLAPILAGCYGGIAFAAERRERSADFLAMLPTSRVRIVLSKSITGWGCSFAPWLLSILVILATDVFTGDSRQGSGATWREVVMGSSGALIMCFGLAWLLSTFLESPAISSSISIGVTVALVIWFAMHDRYLDNMSWWMIGIGATGYIAGTIYYLRRIEP